MTQIKQVGGRIFEQMLQDHGVNEFNGAQGKILYVLWQYPELSITKISKLTSLAKTTLTSMLDRMEDAGLVERRHNPDNRREVMISITLRAQHLRKSYEDVSDQVNKIYYRGFTEPEVAVYERYLARILGNLETYEEHNRRKTK